ncbi:MAG: thiamine phosphate synthase [Rhodobacterales bacterium CG_4_9_14_3_um_filter_71_31]|nr:MAG: thiamine phosphate synthase [Rhodobacterales bacterium CG_4_9_14_3_um_filter_71_31]
MTAGLYLITPATFQPGPFAESLKAALDAAPVACVRLSLEAGEDAIRRAADALRPVCAARDVALTIADHVRLVAPHGLDGVHLTDAAPAAIRKARETLGAERIVGAHGGATRHRAMTAAEAGADYVSLGPVRAGALGDGLEASAELFDWWAEMIETPSVAEGGLTPQIAATLNADFFAPRISVWEHPDGAAAAVRAYAAALG